MYEFNDEFEKVSIKLKTDTSKVLSDVQKYAEQFGWGPLNQLCYTNTIQQGDPKKTLKALVVLLGLLKDKRMDRL